MYRYILRLGIFSIFIYWIGSGCASGGQLTGGPKDVTPPQLDTLLSPPFQKTNFFPTRLEFVFDEFIQVKDPVKQVLVSPPLTYIPKVKERGKRVTFEFDPKETLRPDATYTINFGESIVDFREGNKLTNFSYVFSTGDYIDSLTLKGRVINSLTNKGDEDMVVFLYDTTQDSVVRKEKPFYFAKPDKTGSFEFKNIKSDTFKLFALNDKNLNYKYDLDIEKIAFPDSLYFLDSGFHQLIVLRSSLPVPPLKKLSQDAKTYGQAVIQFNTPLKSPIPISLSDSTVSYLTDIIGDSLLVYYETNIDSFYIFLPEDTLTIKPRNKTKFLKDNPFKWTGQSHKDKIVPKDSLLIHFNFPITFIDNDLITVSDTIGPLDDFFFELTENKKSLKFKIPYKAGEMYTLTIDSAALTSIHGQVNNYVELNLEALTKNKTATLLIQVNELDKESQYVFYVLSGKNIIFEDVITEKDSAAYKIENLLPAQYDIEIFEDKNNNKQWDPGHYDLKIQPEYYTKIIGGKIRENRDTEMEVKWKSLISGTELKEDIKDLKSVSPNKNNQR